MHVAVLELGELADQWVLSVALFYAPSMDYILSALLFLLLLDLPLILHLLVQSLVLCWRNALMQAPILREERRGQAVARSLRHCRDGVRIQVRVLQGLKDLHLL